MFEVAVVDCLLACGIDLFWNGFVWHDSEAEGASATSASSVQTQNVEKNTVAMVKIRMDTSSDAHAATNRIISAFDASNSQKRSDALQASNLGSISIELAEKPGDWTWQMRLESRLVVNMQNKNQPQIPAITRFGRERNLQLILNEDFGGKKLYINCFLRRFWARESGILLECQSLAWLFGRMRWWSSVANCFVQEQSPKRTG